MISVIIPTLNAASSLPRTLASLLDANQQGVIREVIISDGGSVDQTKEVAHHAGATLIEGPKGRGSQLAQGAAAAKGEWLLFLHADTQLEKGWQDEAMAFCQASCRRRVAVFRLKFDEKGWRPFLVAMGANLRARFLRLPYGDQGLLISRAHYDHSGGFANMPLMEDVDMIRRLVRKGGRGAMHILPAAAITSAARYREDGFFKRVLRNSYCLSLYFRKASPDYIWKIYHGTDEKALSRYHGKVAQKRPGENTS